MKLISKLYILLRTDMASMDIGRCAAMASHATSAFEGEVKKLNEKTGASILKAVDAWRKQTKYNFGTVIVLDGKNMDAIKKAVSNANFAALGLGIDLLGGIFDDPEYCIKDGETIHLIPDVPIGGFIFVGDSDVEDDWRREVLGEFELLKDKGSK